MPVSHTKYIYAFKEAPNRRPWAKLPSIWIERIEKERNPQEYNLISQ